MGGAVKSVSKLANKAVGGANKAIGGILGGNKKAPKNDGSNDAMEGAGDDSTQPFSGLANQLGMNPSSNAPQQAAINPFAAPKRAGFVLPKFNQMQARMEQAGQPISGQPQQPVPGQPPQLNQGGMMNRFKNRQQQPQGPQAPMAPVPGATPAPMAAQAPAPGQPPMPNPTAPAPMAPMAPEIKPPAPVQAAPAAPVQQQQAPGTPAPGAAPAAGTAEAPSTVSPEEQFKKTQNSMYQVNK